MNALSSSVLNISSDEASTSSHEGLFSCLIGIFVRKYFPHADPCFLPLHNVISLFCDRCFNFYEIWETYHLSLSHCSWIIHNPRCLGNARDKQPVAEQLTLHWEVPCAGRHVSWQVLGDASFYIREWRMSSETEEMCLPKHIHGNIAEISRGAEANSPLLWLELFFLRADGFDRSALLKSV